VVAVPNSGRLGLVIVGESADEIKRLQTGFHDENLALREDNTRFFEFDEIVGCSQTAPYCDGPRWRTLSHRLQRVMISGETGTGKELTRAGGYQRSHRVRAGIISVNSVRSRTP